MEMNGIHIPKLGAAKIKEESELSVEAKKDAELLLVEVLDLVFLHLQDNLTSWVSTLQIFECFSCLFQRKCFINMHFGNALIDEFSQFG